MGQSPAIAPAPSDTRLTTAWEARRPGSRVGHVVVALPSLSMGESLMQHYGTRVPVLEHRYLLDMLMLGDEPAGELVFVTAVEPEPAALEYYAGLHGDHLREDVLRRLHVIVVPDASARPLSTKLLEHPRLLDRIRRLVAGRPAMLEAWNVTEVEVAVARAIDVPLHGTPPQLWPLGTKSAGRRLLREVGVPVPLGREGVHDAAAVLGAVEEIRRQRPAAPAVVVKHDDTCSGDGNLVLPLTGATGEPLGAEEVQAAVHGIPEWFLADLRAGGVVEEHLGAGIASPSVQLEITPQGEVEVLATHDQVLDGDTGQVYQGCRFPADPAYAPALAAHAVTVSERLAREGVRGRLSVDFVATPEGRQAGRLHAIEMNLRRGGTTHPFDALRRLVPGRYDAPTGRYLGEDGQPRCYVASDNLHDPAWHGLAQADVIAAVADAGLQLDRATGRGVVLHMLPGLGVDGRIGFTAIDLTPGGADRLAVQTRAAIDALT